MARRDCRSITGEVGFGDPRAESTIVGCADGRGRLAATTIVFSTRQKGRKRWAAGAATRACWGSWYAAGAIAQLPLMALVIRCSDLLRVDLAPIALCLERGWLLSPCTASWRLSLILRLVGAMVARMDLLNLIGEAGWSVADGTAWTLVITFTDVMLAIGA